MPSQFVSKLAAKGARDPEALAAWIGRQKFGKKAFGRLAAAGRKNAKEERHIMGRVRPGGRVASDLTGLSDDELGRSLRHLDGEETSRVAAEMDQRDIAARLPGGRPDLIGLSDTELAIRARGASSDELNAIAGESDRRERVASVFPSGRLSDDLSGLDEGTLGWAIPYARPDEIERIAAEIDRRHPPAPLPKAAGSGTVAGQLADRAAVEDALGSDPHGWAHLSADLPDDPRDSMSATERWIADREDAEASARAAYSRETVRDMYRDHTYGQYMAAEDELRGVLLSRKAASDGVDPISLFSGPSHIAYARASEELKRWWIDNRRTTLAEYEEQVSGQRSAAGERARVSRGHQQNRL
ncbi:hypothetical protein ACFW9O_17770 [Streptomyces sp. NPDC059499]|uniref:hypothetical protein n=1 Tax=Streptomyces sp. NPDC059499 TaxID=3346852 RepID=UPI003676D90C